MKSKTLNILLGCVAALLSGMASAQIVVVCGAQSPITNLTRQEAEQLYLGRSNKLSSGIAVTLTDLPNGAIRDQFYEVLTGKNPSQIRAYWSRMVFTGRALPPQEAASAAEARNWLTLNPNLIAYLPAAEADAKVRILLRLP